MKKTKVLLAGALVLALGLVMGCKMGAGDGEVTGTKWDSTLTVDASESAKELLTKKYRRFWKQLGTSEKVTKVQTTLTVDTANSITSNNETEYASIGFIFNMHEYKAEKAGGTGDYAYEAGDSLVEFLILGYQPGTGRAYLDHYWGIPKKGIKSEDGKTTLDTDLSAIAPDDQTQSYNSQSGEWIKAPTSSFFTWQPNEVAAFISKTSKDGKTVSEGFTVRIEEAEDIGTYSIKLQNVASGEFEEVATYSVKNDNAPSLDNTKAQGGVGVYANVPKDCKLIASYVQDKDNTVGLYVEEE